MDLKLINDIKELLVPIATAVTLLSVAISSWLALRQYRLKLKSEKVENDIKLIKAFCELLNLAHARSQTAYSEKFLDKLFEKEIISKDDFEQLDLNQKIDRTALVVPVGSAAQDGAIAAIAALGLRHGVLKDASIQALESLATGIPAKSVVVSEHLRAAKQSEIVYRLCQIKHWLFGR